jgi:hypothetical protein
VGRFLVNQSKTSTLVIDPLPLFMKAPIVRTAPDGQKTDCRPVSRQWPKVVFRSLAVDVNVKLLESPDGRNHLLIIISGLIEAEGLERIFRQVAEIIQHQFNCTVLIDFERASWRIEPKDMDEVVHQLGADLRLGNIKIAMVSSAEIDESEQLKVLSDSLCREDLKAAVFDNAKEAIDWLINTI